MFQKHKIETVLKQKYYKNYGIFLVFKFHLSWARMGCLGPNRFSPAAVFSPILLFHNSAALSSPHRLLACLINCSSSVPSLPLQNVAHLPPQQESSNCRRWRHKRAAWRGVASLRGRTRPKELQDLQPGGDPNTSEVHLDANIADGIFFSLPVPFTCVQKKVFLESVHL